MKMLDYEMKKTDDLLYRMIPKPVAKRLRKGEPAVNTCEVRSADNAAVGLLRSTKDYRSNTFSCLTLGTL